MDSVVVQHETLKDQENAYLVKERTGKKDIEALRTSIAMDLIKKKSLRKGILLKEILDKPLAMREAAP